MEQIDASDKIQFSQFAANLFKLRMICNFRESALADPEQIKPINAAISQILQEIPDQAKLLSRYVNGSLSRNDSEIDQALRSAPVSDQAKEAFKKKVLRDGKLTSKTVDQLVARSRKLQESLARNPDAPMERGILCDVGDALALAGTLTLNPGAMAAGLLVMVAECDDML